MKRSAFILLTLTVLATGCDPVPRDKPAKSGTEIEGKWAVVSSEVEGRPSPEDADPYTRMTFSGEDATLESRMQKHELRFTLDTSKQPKRINLYSKQEKVLWKGIYKVEGASLRLSYGQPDGARPTSLETSRGAKAILYVLKRMVP
jgi:uncharacterized protein (TIGR03067 family)